MGLTLIQLRTKAAELSGRYDLVDVDASYSDNGMDFFIDSAQNFLDRLQETPKSTNTIFEEISAGTWYFDFQRCYKIEEVWVNNTEGRSQLKKKNYIELKNLYPSLISETDQGTPLYYTPAPIRSSDDTDIDNLGSFFNHTKSDDDTYQSIIILPPPDESVVIELKGLFYADTLVNDNDTNFWTNNYPDIFLMAIMYKLETFNRSTRSMDYWLNALIKELSQIDKNMVAEEIHEITQIKD